ncbi:MAG: ribosome small subunit-dependent GTPase A [bacterium]
MIGKVIKIHSDFYYVNLNNNILECKIREKLKKEKIEIFVGDLVKIEKTPSNSKQAAIIEVLPRNNYLPRPSISNVDQVLIVAALTQSKLEFEQLNRYLCQAKLYDIPAFICINKSDLDETLSFKQKILDIYTNIGYKVIFTSALSGFGIDELINTLESKVTVLCGMSGVGKTSLLNKIHPELKLKTKEISAKTNKGTHTTRHVEILEVPCLNKKTLQVADTPGFSYLKFDTVMPSIINELFDEIKEFSSECYFSDCLHLNEEGCNVLANVSKIDSTRYGSYKTFVREAVEYKEKIRKEGHKEEKSSKSVDTGNKEMKQLIKLGTQARKKSRNTEKQKMNLISILDEVYYNQNQEDFD